MKNIEPGQVLSLIGWIIMFIGVLTNDYIPQNFQYIYGYAMGCLTAIFTIAGEKLKD